MEKKEHPSAEDRRQLVDSLYREYCAFLVDLAQRCGFTRDTAEDLVQETFQIAISKSEDLYASENSVGWLVNTLRHRIGHNYRAMKYAQKLQQYLRAANELKYEDQLDLKYLYSGLVSEDDLSILISFYVEGYSIEAISDRLHISLEAGKKRIQRAKARFYKAYKKYIMGLE